LENLAKLDQIKGQRVLITGHTGFKGSWFSSMLILLGAEVYGISLPPEKDSLFEILNPIDETKSFYLDIRDKKALEKKIEEIKPQLVVHLAAQSLVLKSYEFPFETFEVNFMGTLNLLEILRKQESVLGVLVITTDKVYATNDKGLAFVEGDPLGGNDPYSSSKATIEIMLDAYRNLNWKNPNVKIVSARAGNVIGGGDRSQNRLFPDLVRALESSSVLQVRNPTHVRPWQHVLEPLFAYLLVLLKILEGKEISNAFNFGPDKSQVLNVSEVIAVCKSLLPNIVIDFQNIDADNGKEGTMESKFLLLDSGLAKKELGWAPIYDTEMSIRKTLEWEIATKISDIGKAKVTEQILDFIKDVNGKT
jgi:CDP-glucose 4,6-dehydratase